MKPQCPICKSGNYTYLKKYSYITDTFKSRQLYRCGDCSTVSVHPMLGDKEFSDYYADYWKHFGESTEVIAKAHALSRAQYLNGIYPMSGKRVLDFGCGLGYFYDALKTQGIDCKYVAFDLDKSVEEDLKNKGADEFYCKFEDLKGGQYDVIVLSHVLEHQTDPNSFLTGLDHLLSPNGVYFIEIPNSDFIYVVKLEPHTFSFTPETITNFYNQNGYEIIDLSEFGKEIEKLIVEKGRFKSLKLAIQRVKPLYDVITKISNRMVESKNSDTLEDINERLKISVKGNGRWIMRTVVRKK